MTQKQKAEQAQTLEEFIANEKEYCKRKNKLINELSMSIFEKSVRTDKDGKSYFSRESFLFYLNAIANNILDDSKVTISVEPLLPEL